MREGGREGFGGTAGLGPDSNEVEPSMSCGGREGGREGERGEAKASKSMLGPSLSADPVLVRHTRNRREGGREGGTEGEKEDVP